MKRILPFAAAGLLGCQAAFAPAKTAWPPLPDGHFMHVGGFLQVTGTGRPLKATVNETQEKSEARDAAMVDAWTRLKAYLGTLPLPGGGTVGGNSDGDAALAKTLEKLSYSAQIVSTTFSGSTAVVVMRVEKAELNQAFGTDFK